MRTKAVRRRRKARNLATQSRSPSQSSAAKLEGCSLPWRFSEGRLIHIQTLSGARLADPGDAPTVRYCYDLRSGEIRLSCLGPRAVGRPLLHARRASGGFSSAVCERFWSRRGQLHVLRIARARHRRAVGRRGAGYVSLLLQVSEGGLARGAVDRDWCGRRAAYPRISGAPRAPGAAPRAFDLAAPLQLRACSARGCCASG
jgi:hypothetical protein